MKARDPVPCAGRALPSFDHADPSAVHADHARLTEDARAILSACLDCPPCVHRAPL